MKCQHCDVCGKRIESDKEGSKLCIPVLVGTNSGKEERCWCLCYDCKEEFLLRSAQVLQERKS